MKTKSIFITATDTNVGKTVATLVLGVLLQNKGINVGVMKPVQCGGDDAKFLRNALRIKDSLPEINPYFAKEPLSPHLAFARAKIPVDQEKIIRAYEKLKGRHEIILVEGAGGILAPLKEDYLVADLIADFGAPVIIIARLGLGTINHTLLTIKEAQSRGLKILGVIFCQNKDEKSGIPEKTNPAAIKRFGNIPVLGIIPYLSEFTAKEVLKKCSTKINLKPLLSDSKDPKNSGNPMVQRLKSWDKKYIWHPFTQMKDWLLEEPLVIEEAKGSYIKDTNGRWYLDGVSSLWVNVHGHRHPTIDAAIKKQINQLSHSTLLGLSNPPAVELAKKLVEIAPEGLKKVFYSDNGSTAVEVAVKMAYQYWQNKGNGEKRKIIHLENSYHGDTLGSMSVGGISLFHKVYKDLIFETIAISAPFDRNLKKLFERRADEIAAIIVEPLVQAAAGMLLWPSGILKGIEKLCRAHNVFLIADEVATGFGRTGKMFACEHEDVHPDFLCLAKGLTGGYLPLAATLTTQKVFNGFLFDYKDQKTFFHGHTYTGNPLACAAALANLEIFKKEDTLAGLSPKIKYLAKSLKKFYNLSHVGEVRQKGFMVGIELIKDKAANVPYDWQEKIGIRVCREIKKHGVILRPLGNVIVLMPPLSISLGDLEKLLSKTYETIRKVTADSE